jgi:AcrR family transcriptional regulator
MNLETPDRGNASGRATRDLLIRTAERLFAERGIGAVSLREIGQAAGQRNNAVTQYHFGSRQDLIDTIYVYRAATINRRRHELLAELEADGRGRQLEEILWVTLRPHAESISDPDDNFLGFLARVLTDEARISVVTDEQRPQVVAHLDALRTLRALARDCLPGLSRAQFERRFDMIFDWAVHALAEFGRSAKRPPRRTEIDQRLDELVAMLANALRAHVTARP